MLPYLILRYRLMRRRELFHGIVNERFSYFVTDLVNSLNAPLSFQWINSLLCSLFEKRPGHVALICCSCS
jgi:hypothetical protein